MPDGTGGATAPGGDLPDGTQTGTKPTSGGCGGLDYLGACSGDIAQWCADGEVKERDCGARGQGCQYIDDVTGYYCVGAAGGGSTSPPPGSGGGAGSGSGGTTVAGCGNAVETEELELTNQARQGGGLSALQCDDILTQAARAHSQDMCDRGYFSHTGLDGSDFTSRVQRAGGSIGNGGENIAMGQRNAQEVHNSWMNSWGHRANIMNGSYSRIGIGYVDCGGSPLWTQVFSG